MRSFKQGVAVILTVCVLLASTVVFAQEEQQKVEPNYTFMQKVKIYIMQHYNGEVDDNTLIEGALRNIIEKNPELLEQAVEGMFKTLDHYSTYFYEDQYKSFSAEVDGQFGGIGVSVANKNGYITVLAPVDDSPGQRVGLKTGDQIVYVDDVDVSQYDVSMAVPLMRGDPGTKVRIGVKRDGQDDILYFDIVREIIKINPIFYEVKEGEIGYIRISDFNANTEEYFQKALDYYDSLKIKKLILDVRNNPGGSLKQVVDVAKHFVPNEGPIVHVELKNGQKQTYNSTLKQSKYDVAVLINEGSASASEILAGAIQDSKAGKIIGEKSFGKGTVQEVIPLKIGGAIKMTIARYLTPNGTCIDGDGIYPDIKVKNTTEKINIDNLEKLTFTEKLELGDAGEDVLAAEQRLKLLGYDVGEPDQSYDGKTFEAVKYFQEQQGLFPYGVLDFTTQGALDSEVKNVEVVIDKQMEKAIELLTK